MGDAGLSAETFLLNFYIENFLLNYLDLIVRFGTQYTEIVARYGGSQPGNPSWSAAFPEIIYQIAKHGDLNPVRKYYDNMMN